MNIHILNEGFHDDNYNSIEDVANANKVVPSVGPKVDCDRGHNDSKDGYWLSECACV